MNIFMPLDRVQMLVNQTGKINIMKVSNTGDVRGGVGRSDDVGDGLATYLFFRNPILLQLKMKQIYVDGSEEGSQQLQNLQ